MNFIPPQLISHVVIDEQAVVLTWIPVKDAIRYDVKVDGFDEILNATGTTVRIRGLLPLMEYTISIRSVFFAGQKSEWNGISVRTTYGAPPTTQGLYSVIEPIQGYNNGLVFDLPDIDGNLQSCTLNLIWHPSDDGWWADLEVPTGTPVIQGRRMGLNCGILDDAVGVLNGNIVMRATTAAGLTEPDSECFRNKTHELRWEPNQ